MSSGQRRSMVLSLYVCAALSFAVNLLATIARYLSEGIDKASAMQAEMGSGVAVTMYLVIALTLRSEWEEK